MEGLSKHEFLLHKDSVLCMGLLCGFSLCGVSPGDFKSSKCSPSDRALSVECLVQLQATWHFDFVCWGEVRINTLLASQPGPILLFGACGLEALISAKNLNSTQRMRVVVHLQGTGEILVRSLGSSLQGNPVYLPSEERTEENIHLKGN